MGDRKGGEGRVLLYLTSAGSMARAVRLLVGRGAARRGGKYRRGCGLPCRGNLMKRYLAMVMGHCDCQLCDMTLDRGRWLTLECKAWNSKAGLCKVMDVNDWSEREPRSRTAETRRGRLVSGLRPKGMMTDDGCYA